MATSYIEYPGDGTNKVFSVTFPFIAPDHVSVEVDGYSVAFVWLSLGSVQTAESPPIGSIVRIKRTTPISNQSVIFSDSSTLKSANLNRSDLQKLYAVQEIEDKRSDDADKALRKDPLGIRFDALGLPVSGLAEPQEDDDAATASYVKDRIRDAESIEAGQLREDLGAGEVTIGFDSHALDVMSAVNRTVFG